MSQSSQMAHAMKTTQRTGRIKFLSMVFATSASAAEFKEQLRKALARDVQKHGRFDIYYVPNRHDWLVAFKGAWPEAKLDEHLKRVATELGLELYLEPGIPLAEVDQKDPGSFTYSLDPRRRRPDNR